MPKPKQQQLERAQARAGKAEEWRTVPSLPQYEVSSLGWVRHKPFKRKMPRGGEREYGGTEWRGVLNKGRYSILHDRTHYLVSRLVCEAFHGPPFEKAVCMHLNDISSDNRADNLRWGTQKENLNTPSHRAYRRSRVGALSNYQISLARKAARNANS